MHRRKKKPEYNPKLSMDELVKEVADAYGSFDDRKADRHDPSLNTLATDYGLNVLKVRKILITAGVYSTSTSRKIAGLVGDGLSVGEIVKRTELSKASVNSYLPYEGYVYKLPETSVEADRSKIYRLLRVAVNRLMKEIRTTGDSDVADRISEKAIL